MKKLFLILTIAAFSPFFFNFVYLKNLPEIKITGEIESENEAVFNLEFDRMGFILSGEENIDISNGSTELKIRKDEDILRRDFYFGDRYGVGACVYIEIKDIKKPEKYMIPGKNLKTVFKFNTKSMTLTINIYLYNKPFIPMTLMIEDKAGKRQIPVEEKMEIEEKIYEGENFIYISTFLKPLNAEIAKTEILISIKRKDILRLKIGEKEIWRGGEKSKMDTYPFIISGRTFVPIRFVSESLGGKVYWDGKERKVTIYLNDNKIEMWIGKNYAYINGEFTLIDPDNPEIKPFIKDDRTFVPLRFVSESLGMKVIWIGSFEEIFIFQ